MFKTLSLSLLLICILYKTSASSCIKPAEIEATSFTTEDATVVSEIALITEFSLKCANGVIPNALYAEVDGSILTVAKIEDKFQVSWTEDIKKAHRGDRQVRLFDEEGFTTLKRAMRSGESASSVEPLAVVIVNHPGAFSGPWLKSEFMAAALSVVVAYIAFSSKSKLLY